VRELERSKQFWRADRRVSKAARCVVKASDQASVIASLRGKPQALTGENFGGCEVAQSRLLRCSNRRPMHRTASEVAKREA